MDRSPQSSSSRIFGKYIMQADTAYRGNILDILGGEIRLNPSWKGDDRLFGSSARRVGKLPAPG